MKFALKLTFLMLCTNASVASEVEDLIKVTPGTVSEISGKSVGGPFEFLRVPTPSHELSIVFPDLEVMISREGKTIIGVSAKRAFLSKSDCEKSQGLVRKVLSNAFSSTYSGSDPRWQFQTSDSSITAGALCSGAKPYPVLRLDVTHTETNNEIMKRFR